VSTASPLSRHGVTRTLLFLCGALFVLGAAVHNPGCISLAVDGARGAFHRPGIAVPPSARIHDMQWLFLAAGCVLLAVSWLIGRVPALDSFFRRPAVEKLVLVLLVVVTPIVWGEFALRAFVPPRKATTTLFERDDELGWKLRRGASDNWGGVMVHINEAGYRGPVIPRERTAGKKRVLFLGDSVTFGYRIARWQDTFPFLADSLAGTRDSLDIETVNLSVEGYSQWQEAIVMAKQGAPYRPDLVVLGFVLNDVTEMFHLVRFGGAEEGFQMRHAASNRLTRLLQKSAIVYEVQNVTREIKAKRRLGEDVRLGAIKQQALEVETLMRRPDQANVKTAWDYALADLQKIDDQCRALGIPLLVAAFPFAVQIPAPDGLSAPQRVLESYTHARNIAMIDMLPPLAAAARADSTSPLFLDEDHFSPQGHRVVAGLLAPVIAGQLRKN
jgi:lysophospholipase L1-like esterase